MMGTTANLQLENLDVRGDMKIMLDVAEDSARIPAHWPGGLLVRQVSIAEPDLLFCEMGNG